jgi:hypothetical protein
MGEFEMKTMTTKETELMNLTKTIIKENGEEKGLDLILGKLSKMGFKNIPEIAR